MPGPPAVLIEVVRESDEVGPILEHLEIALADEANLGPIESSPLTGTQVVVQFFVDPQPDGEQRVRALLDDGQQEGWAHLLHILPFTPT